MARVVFHCENPAHTSDVRRHDGDRIADNIDCHVVAADNHEFSFYAVKVA